MTSSVSVFLGVLANLALAIFAPQASAAEYEIVRYSAGKNYSATSPNHSRLGEPYPSKADCDVAIARVRVVASGVRLQCNEVATRSAADGFASAPTDR